MDISAFLSGLTSQIEDKTSAIEKESREHRELVIQKLDQIIGLLEHSTVYPKLDIPLGTAVTFWGSGYNQMGT